MKEHKLAIQYSEGKQLLIENSCRVIPFNILMAALLSVYLSNNHVPTTVIILWFAWMLIVNSIRYIHCRLILKKKLFDHAYEYNLGLFFYLTLLAGIVWSTLYFILLPYANESQLYLILLVFGGMTAGSTTTLSIYLPSFFAFTLSIFAPAILYNYYLWSLNSSILATMAMLFVIGITIIARSNQSLLRKIFFLTKQNETLMNTFKKLSVTDALTGLYNRRNYTKMIKEEYNRAKRNQDSFVLLSIDIDNFKLINDSFGHTFGDSFIVYTANYLKYYLRRANDLIFRMGGDEFAILLVNISEDQAKHICNAIMSNFIKNPKYEYATHDNKHDEVLAEISLSLGMVYVPYDTTTSIDQIIEYVDQTLYKSKNSGKNKISYIKL